ncbi:four helix bundle protein [Hymenobacter busanensis]|uniref:Four helix bundle protein n=1 Tax=Hymenobacter busanensis TaxID=2607656 RepID=A0A7L5A2Q8_9BACT|nr:four helix bundle protein [Hymenobacter busanensis]KAA9338242.1 four helix bundle protein [Hymenobacter busanensis]QHJ09335.1 four helix bundle protein [Hymenobacter busanensis]
MAEQPFPAPKYLRLGDIECYRVSFALSNVVWQQVKGWPAMAQRTVGEQFVRATDSISANIAEGFGRYGKKDKIKFYRIAQGSLFEALDWNEKSKIRQLTTPEQYEHVFHELQRLPKMINALVKYTNSHLTI